MGTLQDALRRRGLVDEAQAQRAEREVEYARRRGKKAQPEIAVKVSTPAPPAPEPLLFEVRLTRRYLVTARNATDIEAALDAIRSETTKESVAINIVPRAESAEGPRPQFHAEDGRLVKR